MLLILRNKPQSTKKMIDRILEDIISQKLYKGKAIIITGPRQSGKTTLLKKLRDNIDIPVKWFNGDEADVRILLSNTTSTQLRSLIANHKLVVIDEAQRIENIGLTVKLLTDNYPDIQVIASGSSSFELANRINEPLTGRKWEYHLFPFSYAELTRHFGHPEELRMLENRMIFGMYPEVVTTENEKKTILNQLADSYLYRDILIREKIKKPEKLENLLRALAFQIGSEVSFNELGKITGLDNETVEKYINLLEKTFIIFRLGSLSRNLRNELKKSRKIYFYDTGIRNSIINNYNPLKIRDDICPLWENFLVAERLKHTHYNNIYSNKYFWRTHQQQEIDYIEERDGKLFAFEFKWSNYSKEKMPLTFLKAYPDSITEFIDNQNFLPFLGI
jgi:uncharacterized protein